MQEMNTRVKGNMMAQRGNERRKEAYMDHKLQRKVHVPAIDSRLDFSEVGSAEHDLWRAAAGALVFVRDVGQLTWRLHAQKKGVWPSAVVDLVDRHLHCIQRGSVAALAPEITTRCEAVAHAHDLTQSLVYLGAVLADHECDLQVEWLEAAQRLHSAMTAVMAPVNGCVAN